MVTKANKKALFVMLVDHVNAFLDHCAPIVDVFVECGMWETYVQVQVVP